MVLFICLFVLSHDAVFVCFVLFGADFFFQAYHLSAFFHNLLWITEGLSAFFHILLIDRCGYYSVDMGVF